MILPLRHFAKIITPMIRRLRRHYAFMPYAPITLDAYFLRRHYATRADTTDAIFSMSFSMIRRSAAAENMRNAAYRIPYH